MSPNIQSGFLHGLSRKARVSRLRNERIYEKWELLTLILKMCSSHILSKSETKPLPLTPKGREVKDADDKRGASSVRVIFRACVAGPKIREN